MEWEFHFLLVTSEEPYCYTIHIAFSLSFLFTFDFWWLKKENFFHFVASRWLNKLRKHSRKFFFFFRLFIFPTSKTFSFFFFLFFFSLKEIFLCWYFTFIGARFRFIFHEILSEISKNWILKSAFLISMYERESLFEFNIFRIENDPSNPYHVKHIPKR